jgi:hypothetical protein
MFVVSVLVTVSAVASPELSMVATAVFEDVQVTELVRSTVVAFCRMPTAVYCCVAPGAIDWLAGVIEIDARFATVTFTVVEPLTPASVALIVADPAATAVTNPVALTFAIATSDDAQLAESVIVCVVLLS